MQLTPQYMHPGSRAQISPLCEASTHTPHRAARHPDRTHAPHSASHHAACRAAAAPSPLYSSSQWWQHQPAPRRTTPAAGTRDTLARRRCAGRMRSPCFYCSPRHAQAMHTSRCYSALRGSLPTQRGRDARGWQERQAGVRAGWSRHLLHRAAADRARCRARQVRVVCVCVPATDSTAQCQGGLSRRQVLPGRSPHACSSQPVNQHCCSRARAIAHHVMCAQGQAAGGAAGRRL
jgi:hypothetical protein